MEIKDHHDVMSTKPTLYVLDDDILYSQLLTEIAIAQGYFIARPMPASEMTEWIKKLASNPLV